MIGDDNLVVAKLYDMIHPNASGGSTHCSRQCDRAIGVHHRPGQEGQGHADLPDERRAQLR
jgi:hypothetical protein